MKKYIYYPNFEPPDREWLRFSILYLDKFESIVPYDRRHLISDDFRKLEKETDLLELFSPEFDQVDRATIRAIQEAERFVAQTYRMSSLFNNVNIHRDWKNPNTWDYQIYGEKISYSWSEFCEREKIGRRNNEGIVLPRSLAFLYMTHLAKEIAFDRQGDIITDNLEYDRYTSYLRIRSTATNTRDSFIRGVIGLKVPRNLNEISFDRLIEFRKNNRELIRAFNIQINNVEDSIGNGITEQQFIDNYNYTFGELGKAILKFGIDLATIPLSFYTLAQNSQALNQEYVKEFLGGMSIAAGGYHAVKKSFYNRNDGRQCKKYLARLSHLR